MRNGYKVWGMFDSDVDSSVAELALPWELPTGKLGEAIGQSEFKFDSDSYKRMSNLKRSDLT